jgi:hypothetical protein
LAWKNERMDQHGASFPRENNGVAG